MSRRPDDAARRTSTTLKPAGGFLRRRGTPSDAPDSPIHARHLPARVLSRGPEDAVAFDAFTVPETTHTLADARPRSRVVVTGTVWEAEPVDWVGGPVLEVTLVDPTGRITLAFMGRRAIAGLQPGRRIAAAGTVAIHRARLTLLNPHLWLLPTLVEQSEVAEPEASRPPLSIA